MHWEKITLVGVGLLGGSLGLAIRKNSLAKTIEGYIRRTASIEECQTKGAVTRATTDLSSAIIDADLIILCTPIGQMRSLVKQFIPVLKPGAIVTDVGSVKRTVVADLESIVSDAGAHFVGSHPMAGAEKTGVNAARPDLFNKAVTAITPSSNSHPIQFPSSSLAEQRRFLPPT